MIYFNMLCTYIMVCFTGKLYLGTSHTHTAVTFIHPSANANAESDGASWLAAALHIIMTLKVQCGSMEHGHTHHCPAD